MSTADLRGQSPVHFAGSQIAGNNDRLSWRLANPEPISMITARLPTLALIAALAVGASVLAQESPVAPPAHRSWDPAQMRARMEERRTARLHALHEALGIRPDQEAAFAAFAAAMRPPEGDRQGMHPGGMSADRAALANLTTPERLDRMGQRMQEHVARRQEAFARRASATKALYSALSPGQRRTMDALPPLRGGHREGWDKGRGHGMGDHGQG
jgi:protein CpxP